MLSIMTVDESRTTFRKLSKGQGTVEVVSDDICKTVSLNHLILRVRDNY